MVSKSHWTELSQVQQDEAKIRRDKDKQNALRGEVRAAKKKWNAIEEAKVKLAEKEAKEKRDVFERSMRLRVETPQL